MTLANWLILYEAGGAWNPMLNTKVPREKIEWFPTVDNEVCIGDQECFNFCKNDVFAWDEAVGQPAVVKPYKCVLGCNACMQICPVDAITFPSQQELRRMIHHARGPSNPTDLAHLEGQ